MLARPDLGPELEVVEADLLGQLSAQCEGASTPGLVRTPAVVPLTSRERDVAMLAAAGHSSRVILSEPAEHPAFPVEDPDGLLAGARQGQ